MPITLSATNGITLPSWTTATRPASPTAGQQGFNTTTSQMEIYDGTNWEIYTAATSQGTAGQALISSGSGSAPTWTTINQAISWQSVQTGNFSAVAGRGYPINTTSGAVTVTMPASASVGDIISFIDYAGTWATNNVTLNRNGLNIQGNAANAILSTNRQSENFVYVDATQGWLSYSDTLSKVSQPYNASWLLVAGAGGGGSCLSYAASGGGGAGGYGTASNVSITPGQVLTITVGAGGAGGSGQAAGSTGSNSVISFGAITETAYGGGGGGGTSGSTGLNGGSAGGGGNGGAGGTNTKGAGTYSTFLGNNGGAANGSNGYGGGGGGSGGAGTAGTSNGTGGAGTASSITGSSVTYAGGGGGGAGLNLGTGGTGGTGGGGGGGQSSGGNGSDGTAGTTNTGSGGGGAGAMSNSQTRNGGAGGSGVVIISVPTINYTGTTTGSPTVTTSGSNTILKFTASGTYTA